MNSDEIIQIINEIPNYIQYIYPGYLTMYLYLFFRGKSVQDSKAVIVKAIAISYLQIEVVSLLSGIGGIIENICYILLALVSSYLAFCFISCDRILELMNKMRISSTFYDNEIEMLAEFNKGAWLIVYLKEGIVYEGSLATRELEDGKRKHITLNKYCKYYSEEKCMEYAPVKNYENNSKESVLIFYEDIKRIEKRDV